MTGHDIPGRPCHTYPTLVIRDSWTIEKKKIPRGNISREDASWGKGEKD
ncbi:hypothetical protein CORC01_06795 [Colletotrichum orchidophilum]|uniref:Uncharacterized protein n=1 Tax=Colletotrichum orchidophilum TaxID=1209926 RepID=A0A1G4B9H9_9PEZI|nr:uncharacterized protein CORC01_06795 [Colletotrichum orchidophilum]OHE97932.1 hypothetical protein CORC01_06795 [Colletotrichum orchidophilum]